MAYLAKQLLQPVVIVWIALIAMCGWQIYRRQRRWAAINGALVFFLFLFGNTTISINLIGTLEKSYIGGMNDRNATADAVVVLGGYVSGGNEELTRIDASEAFDRILTGIELIKEGKAGRLYVGGGMYRSNDGRKPEFGVIEPWIRRWNLTDVPIGTLGDSGNTYGESQAVKKLMDENGWSEVFLVTTAWHMPRAQSVFEASGVKVIPVGCDFRSIPENSLCLLPQIGRLQLLQIFLQEKVGWLYYRSRGWIKPVSDE